MTTIDALMKLADAYAEASFDKGLAKRINDPEPEKHREALVAALARAEQAEPVAGQCRFAGVAWGQCDVAHVHMVQANPDEWKGYEVRLLYTTPPAAPAKLAPCPTCESLARAVMLDQIGSA